MSVLPFISLGMQLIGGLQQKRAADRAAEAAQEAGEFNAQIIERDINLLQKQRDIINKQFSIDSFRNREAFEDKVQSAVRSGAAFAGFEMTEGTPLEILKKNAREFDYQQKVEEFNNSVTNMQINDAQEEARLNAELSRMEGGMAAASARSAGRASLISSVGAAAQTAYGAGLFGGNQE
jgi:hypothetical protein